jgi:cytochrome c oxidase subunit III
MTQADVGTIKGLSEQPEARRVRNSALLGVKGGQGGRSDRGGSDGSDNEGFEPDSYGPEKARIITWFVLLVVLMTFGGLIAAYIVLKTNGAAEWRTFALPSQVWVSTALLVFSSITFHFSRGAIDRQDQRAAKKWLLATTFLGAAFVSSQFLVWMALAGRGLYLSGNPYAGFFYILTAVHAVHVAGGIAALGGVLLNLWYPVRDSALWSRLSSLGQTVGWYWHFMDGLWLVLLILLGFWN